MVDLIKEDSDKRKIDKNLVKKVADNSRLKLTDKEIEKFSKQLNDILSAFKELDNVDIKETKPSFHPQEISNIWRDDDVVDCKEDMLTNAKNKEDKYFKGPRIV